MQPLYLNDNFYWGYDDGKFNHPESVDSVLKFKISSPVSDVLDLKEESVRTALLFKDYFHDETVVINFSGGYDSQIAAYTFKQVGIKFKCVQLVYQANGVDLNTLEIETSEKFSLKHNIEIEKVKVDIRKRSDFYVNLVENKIPMSYLKLAQIEMPLRYPEYLNVRIAGDYISGDTNYERSNNGEAVYVLYNDISPYCNDLGIRFMGQYYHFNPNLLYALTFNEVVQSFTEKIQTYLYCFNLRIKDKYNIDIEEKDIYTLYNDVMKAQIFNHYFGDDIFSINKVTIRDYYPEYPKLAVYHDEHIKPMRIKKDIVFATLDELKEIYEKRNTFKIFT